MRNRFHGNIVLFLNTPSLKRDQSYTVEINKFKIYFQLYERQGVDFHRLSQNWSYKVKIESIFRAKFYAKK